MSQAHAEDMTEIVCQGCSQKLIRHCPNSVDCLWLECARCQMLIGPRNVVFYGKAAKRAEETQKRQNGV